MPIDVNLELQVRREQLKLTRKDLLQIFNVGKSVVDGSQPDLRDSFFSMYPSAAELRDKYMEDFKDCVTLTLVNKIPEAFQTEQDNKARNEVRTFYYKIVEFYQILNKAPAEAQAQASTINITNASLLETLSKSHLPPVPIPTFSGKIGEWPKFRQLFDSMVNSNTALTPIQKYHHLNSALSGDPKSLISAFSVDEENYSKAWDALCKRYENKRLLATSYVDKILDFSPLRGPPSIRSLQEFIANIAESVAALKTIKIQNEADFIWLTLALRKLDPDTRRQFETHAIDNEWPTFQKLVDFIYNKCRILELSQGPSTSSPPNRSRSATKHILATTSDSDSSPAQSCQCSPTHPLYQCPIFRSKSPSSRKSFLRGKTICFNCLRLGHVTKDCRSPGRCSSCGGKHHSLLHSSQQQQDTAAQPAGQGSPPPLIASVTARQAPQVLLGTARALLRDHQGSLRPVRLLVDCGSQFSLVTADCARRLGLSWLPSSLRPLGAGQTPLPRVKGKLPCLLASRVSPQDTYFVEPLVVASITGPLPSAPMKPLQNLHLDFQLLADPQFWEPGSIDFLLGGDLFMKIIKGVPTTIDDNYQALPTAFGLVVMGTTHQPSSSPMTLSCHCLVEPPVNDSVLEKFWETEEVSMPVSTEIDPCEEHFVKTHSRTESGRYVVALPFKDNPDGLESSMAVAQIQYRQLEARMNKNPTFKAKYQAFLQEYLELGHMTLATSPSRYVIPHHGVFKSNDSDSKIRVVFNASANTSNGSLNDKLYVGPKLQRDLTLIILNFRRFAVGITADLVKMYRQILVRPEDRIFQHILWRPDDSQDILVFELNTITYGVASAPYQALRTVIQLIKDEGEAFPLASKALLEDRYVDDIVTGADTIEEAILLRDQLMQLLGKGQFEIHKWASNSPEFSDNTSIPLSLSPKDSSELKILGMLWDPSTDTFFYQVGQLTPKVSKRSILSVIARLFDPMGYLAPVIFKAKRILQVLWQARLDWDEMPPPHLVKEWHEFSSQLHRLNELRIPRYVLAPDLELIQILGFCDASQDGFAAALYLRAVTPDGVKVNLLKAKTKLAPLRTISIPRLELSAAHLLVKLLLSVKDFIDAIKPSQCFLFTDSMIVLAWLKISPNLLQTFVANRISFIVSHFDASQWYHIPSQDNPADVASRGLGPSLLRFHTLWWAGPSCLYNPDWNPTLPVDLADDIPEVKSGVSLVIEDSESQLVTLISTFSNYRKLFGVLSFVKRFIHNCRNPQARRSGPLSPRELQSSMITCVQAVQAHEFSKEFSWSKKEPISKRLQILAAFSDNDNIIRVGGRLQNADLSEETKFPIILPGGCHFVILMIRHLHQAHFHLGFQALQALIRRKFWIFRLRQTIKAELHKCLTCFKMSARPETPFMGNLPSCRVRPSRPFSECGVDYAGPFQIKLSSRRNAPTSKAYLCVFVCMVTRAVHLELVSSLTTDAFLAALDRFVARRSCPHTIYSDCGTNFVGADRRLQELFAWLRTNENQRVIQGHFTAKGLQWHFNPPLSPHFGGIWEAAVKSAKRHLYRVTTDRAFSFEELATLFTRIEAILNSRPLCPMQDDTSQGDVLTPGHFLVGAPLIAPPEEDLTDVKLPYLSRWQLISNCVQHFWRRWHAEYLHSLQKRPKWLKRTTALKEGDLVLIPDSKSLPLQWKLARILKTHPGEDGITRVVTLQDKNGICKRSVSKLVALSHLQEPRVAQE